MPFSYDTFKPQIEDFLKKNSYSHVLDIGAGAGKYSDIVRAINPSVHIEAIEIDPDYISRFHLEDKYNKVHNQSVESWIDANLNKTYDIVIMGDVIEHLKKSVGLDALHFFIYRTRHIIIQWPLSMIQFDWEGHKHEHHISVWTEKDFEIFEHKYFTDGEMCLALIRGFIP